ncbi:MAG: carboxyltransferase domain-containing protein, partial [Gemmatimonas sp.]|nr:carboxyltransferase domain-containing protein [Gemmatimonadaceae bacterium]
GIGGAQTGVYPLVSPGGWNLIGRTPLRIFEIDRDEPALMVTGDRVRFHPITPDEFRAWAE